MKCTQPGAVTSDDLIAYLAGEALPSIVEHVRSCPHCIAEVRSYARSERRLRRILDRFDCPSPETIGTFQLGYLSPVERQQIAGHLVLCPRCAEERRTLQAFLGDELPPLADMTSVLRRVVAMFVPPTREFALATRGAGDEVSQAYGADGLTITLRTDFDRWRGRGALTGLLVREVDEAPEPPFGTAELISATDALARYSTPLDETGFLFEDVLPGTYQLEITLADRVVVVEDLEVGP